MKYKVILECEVVGTLRSPGDIVDHPEDLVADLLEGGKIEIVPEPVDASEPAAADSSPSEDPAPAPDPAPQDAPAPETTDAPTDPVPTDPAPRVIAQDDIDAN